MNNKIREYCDEYIAFLKKCMCAPWTAKTVIEIAEQNGFVDLSTKQKVEPGDKLVVNNDYHSVALIRIGQMPPLETGFNIIATHIDNPQLSLKPSPIRDGEGGLLLKTKMHGGGSWTTWFNRPLGIAGRYFANKLDENGKPILGKSTLLPILEQQFVLLEDIPAVIPLEANHLNSKIDNGRAVDKELDLQALVAIENGHDDLRGFVEKVLKDKGIDLEDCARGEFYLYPLEQPRYIGIEDELIMAHGHDDRSMCFASMSAILESPNPDKCCMSLFFDNEETGSKGCGSATSRWIDSVATEILEKLGNAKISRELEETWAKSFVISSDVGHACIPPHEDLFDTSNAAYMGRGPAIPIDEDGSYASTAQSFALMEDLAKRHDIPLQIETSKQNKPCGTTIGPMIASSMNALVVDIGAPIVSMHAAMEIGSGQDFYHCKELFRHFYSGD